MPPKTRKEKKAAAKTAQDQIQQAGPPAPTTMSDVITRAVAHYRSTTVPANSKAIAVQGPPFPRIGDSAWGGMYGVPPPQPTHGVPVQSAALGLRYGQTTASTSYQYAAPGIVDSSGNAAKTTTRFGGLFGDLDGMEVFKHEDDLTVKELSKKVEEFRESRRALDKRIKKFEAKRAALVDEKKMERGPNDEQ